MANLYLPHPCQEKWTGMTTTNEGKFCNACQKQVIDFSSKSSKEINDYLDRYPERSVCGRFLKDQILPTINNQQDIQTKKTGFPLVKLNLKWLMVLGMLAGMGSKLYAQGAPIRKKDPQQYSGKPVVIKVKDKAGIKRDLLTGRKSFRMKLMARKTKSVRVSAN